jgi:hypothetical protein
LERLLKEKGDAAIAKEIELERILKSPVVCGPPRNQQEITDFFLMWEQALQSKKLHVSISRCRDKGLNWYSMLKKMPEQIKEEMKD